MAGQASRKVRRVRCPQCWNVLEEPPDVSLYRCGGCGNILQAKHWKPGSNRVELSTTKGQEANVFEVKELGTSYRVSTGPPSLESSPDKGNASCLDGLRDSNAVHCEETSVPDVLSKSLEVVACPNEGLFIGDKEPLKQGNLGGQIFVKCNSELNDDNSESTGRSSSDIPSLGEFPHEMEARVPESIQHLEQHKRGHSHEDGKKGDRIAEDAQNLPDLEDPECVVSSNSEYRVGNEHNTVPPENNEKGQISSSDQKLDSERGIKHAEQGQNFEADDKAGGFPITTSSEKKMNVDCDDSLVTGQKPINESLASCYLMRPEDKCSPGERTCDFGKINSVDTMGSLARADLTSQINTRHESMTNRSMAGGYYTYAGSESSYESNHDQISAYTTSRTRRYIGDLRATELLRQDAIRATNVNTGTERNHRTSSLHRSMRSSHWGQDKNAETTGYASENNLGRDRRVIGPSSNWHNLLPPHPGVSSSHKASYSELDRMDLLRTVYELKDQLSRMQFPNKVMRTRRNCDPVVDGKFNPSNCNHLAAKREECADLNCPGAYLQHDQAKSYCGQNNISRLSSLGGTTCHGRHISCTYSHWCPPPDWRYPAQFQLPERSPLQERRRIAKRYVRPIAGAAPLICCYHCSKLLQLPADFLIFKKRRFHRLMCNACEKVLVFSVIQGTRIVPYIADASAPRCSEAGRCSRKVVQGCHSGLMKTVGSVGSSSRINKWRKSTSEIKEVQSSSNPRLHHLMGYSSLSQVLDR